MVIIGCCPSDRFDQAQANKEGWGLFDSSGSAHGDFQLQRLDSQDEEDGVQLDDDDDAWKIVTDQARAGSAYHQEALDLVEELNPLERERIRKATGF